MCLFIQPLTLQVCITVAIAIFWASFSQDSHIICLGLGRDHLQQWNMKGNKCLVPQMVNRHSSKPFLSGRFLLNLTEQKRLNFNNWIILARFIIGLISLVNNFLGWCCPHTSPFFLFTVSKELRKKSVENKIIEKGRSFQCHTTQQLGEVSLESERLLEKCELESVFDVEDFCAKQTFQSKKWFKKTFLFINYLYYSTFYFIV